MRTLRTSRVKKSALLAGSMALVMSGLAIVGGSAQAGETGPGGATNIRGVDPGDTDKMIDRLCSQDGGPSTVSGALNVKTGEFKTYREYTRMYVWAPRGDWEIFSGECLYPEASTWSIVGEEVRISRPRDNYGSLPDSKEVVQRYTSTTSATKSVGGSIDGSLAKSIFTGQLGGNFSYEWGWEKSAAFEVRDTQSIPPCTQVWMTWRPFQRVVRVNPVFKVQFYKWDEGNGAVARVDTWRGRSYDKIYSPGYYIDGISDKYLPDFEREGRDGAAMPDGREAKREKELPDPENCA